MLLKGKIALVTGAASGIGRAIAQAYAREGATMVVSDLAEADGQETAASICHAGGQAEFVRSDVSKPDDARMLVERAVQSHGRLDVACNNAGIAGEFALTGEYPDDAWRRVIDVNLSGVFYGMKHQIARMVEQRSGVIVNISSILGQVGLARSPAYAAAKHGVVGLTQTAALEYSAKGVRVNAVGPGFIHTPMISPVERDEASRQSLIRMHPIGRLGEPEEVAELVLWLSSEKASFVTGAYYAVDGGFLAR